MSVLTVGLVFASFVLTGCDAGRILGLDTKSRIKGSYLVKLQDAELDKISVISANIFSKLGIRGQKVNEYTIGGLHLLSFKSDELSLVESLSEMEGVEYIEADMTVTTDPVLQDQRWTVIPGLERNLPMDAIHVLEDQEVPVMPIYRTADKEQTRKKSNDPVQTDDVPETALNACNIRNENSVDMWGHSRLMRKNRVGLETERVYSYSDGDSGTGVDAYVFDTGIHINHTDFGNRASHGFVASDIAENGIDYDGHGTHVAGTIGGTKYGIAKDVSLISMKVLNKDGSGSTIGILEAIAWAVDNYTNNGKRKSVFNLSLGFHGVSQIMNDALDAAIDEGIPVVVAAGNSALDACEFTPAMALKVITVGATDRYDRLTYFSNWGTCVDVLAPGFNITSANAFSNNGYLTFHGTSMASPHVAGVISRYMSSLPSSPTPTEVLNWLTSTATADKIEMLAIEKGTPNKLLYMVPCHDEADEVPNHEVPPPFPTPPAHPDNGSQGMTTPWYYSIAACVMLMRL